MPIQQSKKQSAALLKAGEPRSQRERDLEKRLQILRRQVYGKSPDKTSGSVNRHGLFSENTSTLTYRPTGISISSDLTYLHKDLLKILIFASIAIGTQVIIFILSQNHLLNIKFF